MFSTIVELEFFDLCCDQNDPNNETLFKPLPPDLPLVCVDSPNHCLLWKLDGTLEQASWHREKEAFVGTTIPIEIPRADIRAWAVLPYPISDMSCLRT